MKARCFLTSKINSQRAQNIGGKIDKMVQNIEEVVSLFEELFDIEFKDSWTVPVASMR